MFTFKQNRNIKNKLWSPMNFKWIFKQMWSCMNQNAQIKTQLNVHFFTQSSWFFLVLSPCSSSAVGSNLHDCESRFILVHLQHIQPFNTAYRRQTEQEYGGKFSSACKLQLQLRTAFPFWRIFYFVMDLYEQLLKCQSRWPNDDDD